MFTIYLTKYKCFDDAFVNGTEACDAEIQKSIWKTTELQYEALFSTNETLLSFPECHCLLEFFQKKNNKESFANTLKQCSDYKKVKECTDGIRGHCYPKTSKDDHHNRSQCMDLFALYKCYDDQFQNTASCNDDMRKPFWEKEHRAFVYRLIIEKNCEAAIQFIDEKIENADQECKSTNSLNCTMLLSLYQRYDEQYQNDTNCDTEKRKNFWEKEKLFLSESDRQCQNVIQFIDEKIENVDQECNSNSAIAFGIQSAVIGLTAIVAIFLKNINAILDHMSYL